MVFLIQNIQNHDSEAIQVKLDGIIRAIEGADNSLLDLEELDEKELDHIRADYEKLAEAAKKALKKAKHEKEAQKSKSGKKAD
ncbi:MAG: low affinity iron permease family protein [Acidobacteria bacterium]|nr:low affinity iron permease family protein [Acidobacteriota bacterium]